MPERWGSPWREQWRRQPTFAGGDGGPQKGPLLGTDPVIAHQETNVDKMIKSISRGLLIAAQGEREMALCL